MVKYPSNMPWWLKRCFVSAGWYRGFILKNPNIKVSNFFFLRARSHGFFVFCFFFSLSAACLPACRPLAHPRSSGASPLAWLPATLGSRPPFAISWSDAQPFERCARFACRSVVRTRPWRTKAALNEVTASPLLKCYSLWRCVLTHMRVGENGISIGAISRLLINT